jgi:hypothetical protein
MAGFAAPGPGLWPRKFLVGLGRLVKIKKNNLKKKDEPT